MVRRQGCKERTFTAICGMVNVVHGFRCLASFLAIGEPRGAGAGAGPASLVGFFSLEGACLDDEADL
jgi:hypothetical protein